MGRLLDELDLDFLLVGDSLGMVVLGHPDTTLVTLEDMLHHTRAVARGTKRTPVIADLPAHSADTETLAVQNGKRLRDAGAHAVKLEGGVEVVPIVRALVSANIPVMAHIGMLPQKVREEGGYRIKGKTPQQAEQLLEDALALDEAGVVALVLELVAPPLASEITRQTKSPTIGIGSGPGCDGQILVTHDLVGMFPWFTPRFVQPKAQLASLFQEAARAFVHDVRQSGEALPPAPEKS